jgi:uroporphyrin-III C-methyltransferase/precorrin-2 dehydrogenase/sirohydrochlorin ferrochelatase
MAPHKPLFPLFLKLAGRSVLVVGAGPVAASKLEVLVASKAKVHVVAPEINPVIKSMAVRISQRCFQVSDLDEAWLVVAAAPTAVNHAVAEAAEERQIFVNAVDDPNNASAYLGGVTRRAGVTVAISTDGNAPALAGLIREGLDTLLPTTDLEKWIAEAKKMRRKWQKDQVPMANRRPQLLQALIKSYDLDN